MTGDNTDLTTGSIMLRLCINTKYPESFHVTAREMTDLDPSEEDHDSQCRVKDHFPVAQRLKVAVLVRVTEQLLQNVVDFNRAVDVEDDAANRHQNYDDVENVPERLEIRQLQVLDLFSQTNNADCRLQRRTNLRSLLT